MSFKKQNAPPLSILLADDDNDECLFFDKALRGISIATHLTTVHDGEELMNYLIENSENLPTILFLDLSMPRKTGFECLIEIKESEKLKNLPVIIFTTSLCQNTYFEESLINTLADIGSHGYIRKPADISQLQQIIHQALIIEMEKDSVKWQSCEFVIN